MKRLRPALVTTAVLFSLTQEVRASEPAEQHQLRFSGAPVATWNKNRLIAERLPDDSGLVISDPARDVFDDAELFRADSPLQLPYGRKELSVEVEVGESHRPLWDNKLLQFQLNGIELAAATDADGEPVFEKDWGGDGKGFLPAESGTYRFVVEPDVQEVRFISFMTAAAEGYDVTLRAIEMTVWPEEDTRPRDYLLRYNRLGYLEDQRRWAVLEWQEDLVAERIPATVRRADGEESRHMLSAPERPHPTSGRRLNTLAFNQPEASGFHTIILPETVERTRHTTAVFKVQPEPEAYREHRDQAWGAFHWFNSAAYAGAHDQDRDAPLFEGNGSRDVRGGWYDAGDYGQYSVNGAWAVALPLLSWVIHPQAMPADIQPFVERNPERPAVLDLVSQELDWLLRMQREDGAVHHKVASAAWPAMSEAPGEDDRVRVVMPISTTATADFSAVMFLAAHAFGESPVAEDARRAERYRQAAEQAMQFLREHPERIMTRVRYDNIEYGGPYTDDDDSDERLWAAVASHWTRDGQLPDDLYRRLWDLAGSPRLGDPVPDWRNVNFLALFNYLAMPHMDETLKSALLERMKKVFAAEREDQLNHPYGLMYAGESDAFDWGSNGVIATAGTQLLWLHRLTGEQRWYDAAFDMSHWFFGLNPHGKVFTVGSSRHQVQQPHFRPLASGALDAAPGLLAGGPNSVELKGDMAAQPLAGEAPMRVYVDNWESWATNEVAINWQAAWASYLSLLTASDAPGGSE